ncbi:MAG: mycofactocin biosynthesis chaperone MftB [Pseudomonadota bacterium]
MQPESMYRLWDGVQVRREKFGLLFYDYRGPKLYFLPSKDLLAPDFFKGRQTARDLVESIRTRKGLPEKMVRERVSEILEMLQAKELIHEQSIC